MNAVAMLMRCGAGQRPKFTGPACEMCQEQATEMIGAMTLCVDCAQREQARRLRRDV